MRRYFLIFLVALVSAPISAQTRSPLWPPATLTGVSFREAGPASMGGRITAIAVCPDRPSTFYLGAAAGGVWKTTNGGTTFSPIFDDYGSGSIGAVAVAASRPDDVWVGTGEANARNSCSFGDGVYKSDDAGKTFRHVGLRDTRHIGRIRVHPRDPDVVFVAGLGHLWGPNPMRGLFRTRDGGETWSQVLAIDADTGCIDVIFHPVDPEVVYAAAYAVRRDGFDTNDPAIRYGEKAGIFRSLDGGNTWTQLFGGLPTVPYGRVGLEVCPAEPDMVWAIVETAFTGRPAPEAEVREGDPAYLGVSVVSSEGGAGVEVQEVLAQGSAEVAGVEVGDIILQIGEREIRDYDSMLAAIRAFTSGQTTTLRVQRGEEAQDFEVTFGSRRAPRVPGTLGGQGANAMDRQGPSGFQTGGVFLSRDRGETWTRVNSLTPRPFYYSNIRVDPRDPAFVFVLGTQLHVSTDGGKRFGDNGAPGVHVDHHDMWIDPLDPRHMLLGNDGGMYVTWDRGKHWEPLATMPLGQFYGVAVDDRQPYWIYGGLQDNGSWGFPSRVRFASGTTHDQVFRVGGGDGFLCAVDPDDDDTVYCASQNGNLMRVDVRTGTTTRIRRPGEREGGRGGSSARYRFNWETPFLLSPHNGRTLYWAGNKVFRSITRGDRSTEISPDITATSRGSATSLAESPREEGVLWVGTDDGGLWVTRDGGRAWTPLMDRLDALAVAPWVSHIEASGSEAGTAYIVLDGHRSHSFLPQVWRTRDYGETFEDLSPGLPRVTTRVLREDPVRPELLYVGTELGVWVSFDQGKGWSRLGGLPTVRVDDMVVHRRDRELVVGTHGRSVWIADCAPLQEITEDVSQKDLHLFDVKDSIDWIVRTDRNLFGARRYGAPSAPRGAAIHTWLGRPLEEGEGLSIEIQDLLGETLAELKPGTRVGLNTVRWNLRQGRGRRARPVAEGTYRVVVKRGEAESLATFQVLPDPARVAATEERP